MFIHVLNFNLVTMIEFSQEIHLQTFNLICQNGVWIGTIKAPFQILDIVSVVYNIQIRQNHFMASDFCGFFKHIYPGQAFQRGLKHWILFKMVVWQCQCL